MLTYSYEQFQNDPAIILKNIGEMLKTSPIRILSEPEFQTITTATPADTSFVSGAKMFGFSEAKDLYLDEDIPRLQGLPHEVGE